MKGMITFDKSMTPEILDIFGMTVNDNGFIICYKSGKNVFNTYGKVVHVDDFAGLRKNKDGKLIVITKDVSSLIENVIDDQ